MWQLSSLGRILYLSGTLRSHSDNKVFNRLLLEVWKANEVTINHLTVKRCVGWKLELGINPLVMLRARYFPLRLYLVLWPFFKVLIGSTCHSVWPYVNVSLILLNDRYEWSVASNHGRESSRCYNCTIQ